MDVKKIFNEFVNYGLDHELISGLDTIYIINKLEEIFCLNELIEFNRCENIRSIDEILDDLVRLAIEKKMIKDSFMSHDLFDTKLMDLMVPKPSDIVRKFFDLYQSEKILATNYFYNLMIAANYIRMNRVNKNQIFSYDSKYGKMIITINLSKPEKDPKDISAEAIKIGQKESYPPCLLCYENLGFSGNLSTPAKNNLRFIPLNLDGDEFYFQYSPYVYYNEHCIVFKREHEPMKIDEKTFRRLFDFLDFLPHYFIGSNADLPIVGGSILSHEHYQGGVYHFPIDDAKVILKKTIGNTQIEYLDWPLASIRLVSKDKEDVIVLATKILNLWQNYDNEKINIISSDSQGLHNTITPIARMDKDYYSLILVLRNNLTTAKAPYGLFHPRESYHHIKKENIGLIEVMGLAILPARLKKELSIMKDILDGKRPERDIDSIAMHKEWFEEIKKIPNVNLEQEVGKVFVQVLEDCNVFRFGALDDIIKFLDLIK